MPLAVGGLLADGDQAGDAHALSGLFFFDLPDAEGAGLAQGGTAETPQLFLGGEA